MGFGFARNGFQQPMGALTTHDHLIIAQVGILSIRASREC
jgi:hypothetical protein